MAELLQKKNPKFDFWDNPDEMPFQGMGPGLLAVGVVGFRIIGGKSTPGRRLPRWVEGGRNCWVLGLTLSLRVGRAFCLVELESSETCAIV